MKKSRTLFFVCFFFNSVLFFAQEIPILNYKIDQNKCAGEVMEIYDSDKNSGMLDILLKISTSTSSNFRSFTDT